MRFNKDLKGSLFGWGIFLAVTGFLIYGFIPKREKWCACVDWHKPNTKDTFYMFTQVEVKSGKLIYLFLHNGDTVKMNDVIAGGNFDGDTSVVITKDNRYFLINKIREGKCGTDAEMDSLMNNPNNDYEPESDRP